MGSGEPETEALPVTLLGQLQASGNTQLVVMGGGEAGREQGT